MIIMCVFRHFPFVCHSNTSSTHERRLIADLLSQRTEALGSNIRCTRPMKTEGPVNLKVTIRFQKLVELDAASDILTAKLWIYLVCYIYGFQKQMFGCSHGIDFQQKLSSRTIRINACAGFDIRAFATKILTLQIIDTPLLNEVSLICNVNDLVYVTGMDGSFHDMESRGLRQHHKRRLVGDGRCLDARFCHLRFVRHHFLNLINLFCNLCIIPYDTQSFMCLIHHILQ